MAKLDVITIGRSSVDLYGAQVGGRLEDMASFRKYVGGSPTNMAIGAARLGLRAAVITKVGDEHMGRFIREQLAAEGVDVRGVHTDPERLTALVILGIRDDHQFPLIFYRENCADMALSAEDVEPDLIAESACLTVTGTHLSHPRTAAAVLRAVDFAKQSGGRTALDIDYRPNLWGLAGHGDGEQRFVASPAVTAQLQATLPRFDLIVGTEEEFHIAGGSTDTIAALRAVRALTDAVLVCKRGPMGAAAFVGPIPDTLDDGLAGPRFPIEVYNVLGAGDGFMAGLLRGWLRDESWHTTLTYADACGAFAVSRHGCAPAYPSFAELSWFLEHGSSERALRHDTRLEQLHWSTTRRRQWPELRVLAFDHRQQLEDIAEAADAAPERIGAFKQLCLRAAVQVADGRDGYGILCDWRLGRRALYEAAGAGLWIGRPVEAPGSRPLALEIGTDYGSALADWPLDHVVKVLCYCHPDDDDPMRDSQEATLMRLARAARANGLDLLLEIIPSKVGPVDATTTATLMRRFYAIGLHPDWWKLEPMTERAAWEAACQVLKERDPWCRGIVVLGLEASEAELRQSFQVAAAQPEVKGFAVGRTIFADAARAWLAGAIDDDDAVDDMAGRFRRLTAIWDEARAIHGDAA
ncbi:MAG: 5-dehydro-2-deoxygluconokinase [Pseudomonadota bacterium]